MRSEVDEAQKSFDDMRKSKPQCEKHNFTFTQVLYFKLPKMVCFVLLLHYCWTQSVLNYKINKTLSNQQHNKDKIYKITTNECNDFFKLSSLLRKPCFRAVVSSWFRPNSQSHKRLCSVCLETWNVCKQAIFRKSVYHAELVLSS